MPVLLAIIIASTLTLAPASAQTGRAADASRAAANQGGSFTPLPFLPDVKPFGDAGVYASTNAVSGNHPVVGIARTASSHGYWEAAVDGGVFAFGDAHFYGSMGGTHLNQPVVGIAATPTGKGYWLVANDGGIFSFGDAHFYGSMGGTPLSQPVVGISATANGKGYYLVATDGGVFTFGNARFHDAGVALGVPVVGIAVRAQGDGYWLVTASGHVVAFGHAPLLTDASSADITKPIVGIAATRSGKGYWIAGHGTAPVYFLRGEKVGAGTRDVHGSASVEATVNLVRDLLAGPNAAERAAGLSSAIPAGTTLNGISRLGPVVTVDLSAQFVSGGGSLSIQERVAQVVFTLTGLPGINQVSFAINGKHVTTIGGEGLIVDPPVTRTTFDSFRPQVLVVTPGPGDVVTSPLVVTGEINSFEGGANFALTAAGGRVLAEGIGTGAMGFWLPFASALAFQGSGAAAGSLVARPSSGIETRPPPDAVIPVRFRP